MEAPRRIADAAAQRIAAAQAPIEHSVRAIERGVPLEAEPEEERKVERIAAVARVDVGTARLIANNEDAADLGLRGESLAKAEAIQGRSVDYLGSAWLEAGRLATRAVARILLGDGRPNGTGFLVSERLLLTNNHVLPSRDAAEDAIVEFRYEIALGGREPSPIRFRLQPAVFFETDERDDLDYTLVALGPATTPGASLAEFGRCPLSASSAKHTVGAPVNIVQHPDGDFKQVVVRENRIVHRGETVLHYLADTEPGSSGSPVFNDEWHVVALHHWGGPHREVEAGGRPLAREVNEGIRVSAIVRELQDRAGRMNMSQRSLLQEALRAPAPGDLGTRVVADPRADGPQGIQPTRPAADCGDERAGSEAGGGAPASRIDRRYSNRRGYNERFLPGFPVPMPQLTAAQRDQAARVRGVGESGNPFELKYQHFSVVVNAERRMPFFSICNVDGAKRIRVDRDTGQAVSGPEATETWAVDPRIPEEVQLNDAFYARLRRDLRTSDFFARGHQTRREDPNWGVAGAAERANDDTYHHPNACPQVNNAFNASQKVWQGIENFVLDSADDANLRVTVITGPVLADDDPEYEDEVLGAVRLPRRFWKVVARVEDGERKVFAVLADQSEAMDALFRARGEGRESFEWPRRLSRELRSTVARIAELTGLDFGDLANHDVFARAEGGDRPISGPGDLLEKTAVAGGFGRYTGIGRFLEGWERQRRESAAGREERRRKPFSPARNVVEVRAAVERVLADDLAGVRHQQFVVVVQKVVSATDRADVDAAVRDAREVRVAVRFGDSRGLPDRVPGVRSGLELHLKGEWIAAEQAFAVGGESTAVRHFTHDPLGFVCTPRECFS